MCTYLNYCLPNYHWPPWPCASALFMYYIYKNTIYVHVYEQNFWCGTLLALKQTAAQTLTARAKSNTVSWPADIPSLQYLPLPPNLQDLPLTLLTVSCGVSTCICKCTEAHLHIQLHAYTDSWHNYTGTIGSHHRKWGHACIHVHIHVCVCVWLCGCVAM